MPRSLYRVLAAAVVGALVATGAAVPAFAAATAKTSAAERKRVDSVKTPRLGWYACYGYAECATVRLPLDYDQPKGKTTEIAVLRVKAKDQKHKIGSLFLNPGGPGGSGTEIAFAAPQFLGAEVLRKFDIVGFDPRGVAFSDNIKCFRSTKDQTLAYAGLNVAFPLGKAQEAAYIKSVKAIGKGCSSTGKPLSGSMSTAEAARDMDVLRRAVGDKKLNYLGFSYGTALGQYYANMFPDRFRALVVDGVLNPIAWTGTAKTQNAILDDRLRSADGAYRALHELLVRCDRAGETHCAFAAGDPVKNYDTIARRLRAKPLVITDEFGTFTITYADFIGVTLSLLYSPEAGDIITQIAQEIWNLLNTPTAQARDVVVQRILEARRKAPARDFPYDNFFEAFSGVTCTDGLHPKDAALWPALVAKADKRAPYFGRAWGWTSAQCARNSWTVRDEDAYRGPWNKRTGAPVLVVGSFWDPATNYDDAVSSSKLLGNARLLSSTNWGHTAYGTSACATGAIDTYLLRGTLPRKGKVCEGDQPFTKPLPDPNEPQTLSAASDERRPPVATRVPVVSILAGTR